MSNAIGTVTANVVANTKGFKSSMKSSVTDMRSWQRQAKKVFTETQLPVEKMSLEVAKLNRMHKLGLISATTHARGVKKLRDEMLAASKAAELLAAKQRTAMAQRQRAALGREGAVVTASTLTKVQRYNKELARLNMLQRRGAISTKTHAIAVRQLNATMVTTSAVTKAASASMRTLTSSMLLFVGPLAAIGALFKGFRMAEDVNSAMTSSLAIMGKVSDEMKSKMQSTAFAVARDTVATAEEASKAYFFLASAGLDAQQSMAAMPTVARFSQAGMFNLSTATDLLTDSQMALGLSSKDATLNLINMTRVGDVLVKANTIANATVQQFSESLTNKAANAARRFGKDIEEVTATLAIFASRGIKGAEAGTQYDIILRNLSIKAIENAAAFKAANIAVFDQAGKMRNLADIVGDMDRKMGDMSDQEKVATLMSLGFTAKTISSTAALMGNSEAMKLMESQLRNAGGTMGDVADKQMTAFGRGWNEIKAAFERASVELMGSGVDALGVAFGFAADKVVDFLDGIQTVADSLTNITKESPDFLGTWIPGLEHLKELAGGMRNEGGGREGGNAISRRRELGGLGDKATAQQMEELKTLSAVVTAEEKEWRRWKQAVDNGEEGAAALAITTTKLTEAVDAYNAALNEAQGFDSDATDGLGELAMTIENANAGAKELAETLKFDRATAGMSSAEKQLQKLKLAGATPAGLAPLRRQIALDKVLAANAGRKKKATDDALKAQTKSNKLQADTMNQGKSITDSLRTAGEIYRDQIADLQRLRTVGAIDDITLQRGQLKAMADVRGGDISGAAAPLRGSAAARQSFVGANEMLKKAEERNRILKDIRRGIDDIEQPQVAEVPA